VGQEKDATDLMKIGDLMGRCGRRAKHSGQACRNWAMHGQTVCRIHGGKAPQALRKAEQRIRDLEHPAISQVAFEMQHGDTSAVRFAAARWLLELLGHKAIERVQQDGRILIEVELVDRVPPVQRALREAERANGHAPDSIT
jgi:hypothetical protein